MAEKGILIADQVGGRSVATRDAVETDDLGNPRLIQRVDVCKGKLPDDFLTNSIYKVRSGITSPESYIIQDINSAGLVNTALDVGDRSTLVYSIAETTGLNVNYITVKPVLFNSTGDVVGSLPGLLVDLAGSATVPYVVDAPNTTSYLDFITQDVTGAVKVNIIIPEFDSTNAVSFDIYAAVI